MRKNSMDSLSCPAGTGMWRIKMKIKKPSQDVYKRQPLGFLLLTIYWFNPLMWLAYVLLCRDIELCLLYTSRSSKYECVYQEDGDKRVCNNP